MKKPPSQRPERRPDPVGKELADFICTLLHTMYVKERKTFQAMADGEGAPLESVVAAAMAQGIQEHWTITQDHDLGDFICEVLHKVYVEGRKTFQAQAKSLDASLEQVAAMALAQGIQSTRTVVSRSGLGIPPIPDNLELPIKALVRAASTLDRLLGEAAEKGDAAGLLRKHLDLVASSVQTIAAWRDHLKLDLEDLLDSLND